MLLLFQKVGCYKDDGVKHDLPDKATVKSVTQEDCVRSCALEEKGYSYFGLQEADRCYCGHRYGKYGKADEALCNMPCKGNDKENCGGNSTNMVYFFGLGKWNTSSLAQENRAIRATFLPFIFLINFRASFYTLVCGYH